MKERVVVALSGGVDSSSTCLMLKERGYEVVAITMQLWPQEVEGGRQSCCGLDAIDMARKVTDYLGIPHYVLDLRKEFEQYVINDFVKSYSGGETPNPCIRCNQFVKFAILLRRAFSIGARYLATGHYARIERRGNLFLLKKGVDKKREQSYFLYVVTQQQLSSLIFPLGDYTKEEIIEYAKKKGLPSSSRASSQELCFTSGKHYTEFYESRFPQFIKPGPIITTDGEVLGQHKGLPYYTVGQREGLGVSVGKPLYVIEIDPKRNALIVGFKEETYRKGCILTDVHYITDCRNEEFECMIKIRYQHTPVKATVKPIGLEKSEVVFLEPQRSPTPGQSVVFYDGEYVLGGGIIESSF